MKLIKTTEAIGQMLCHDMTQILPGQFKGARFKKGHIIQEEDIPVLLSIGKEHIYVWEVNENTLHENEAAEILANLCTHQDPSFSFSEVKEGKIEIIAEVDGVLKIDRKRLFTVNSATEMMIASRHGDTPVKKGDVVAGTRIIPLLIEKEKMEQVENRVNDAPIFTILPYQEKKVGIVTTGNEVYTHRIEDQFTPVVKQKVEEYHATVSGHLYSSDDVEMETDCIRSLLEQGCDMILCTGGMSVDPDDRTPAAIGAVADRVVSYGAPVLPGAMFMVAYREVNGKQIPICGLPGCVMYSKRTIFDILLPRLMADDPITKEEMDGLGEGGLCLNCEICTYPNCGFGKGRGV